MATRAAAGSIDGEWAVVAESDKIAQGIADDAAEAPLSDDEDYQKWTDEVGDAGVINMYAAPAAGKFLADSADGLFGMGLGAGSTDFSSCVLDPEADPSDDAFCDEFEGMTDDSESMSAMPEEFTEALEDFQGAALTVRFDDGALEVEMAGDSALTEQSMPTTDKGDDVLVDPARGHRRRDRRRAARGLVLHDARPDRASTPAAR